MNGDLVYTITSHKVDESNRCDACHFNPETMAECFIFCPFSCKECPWKNLRPEAMKMITETALMTDDEMARKGIEPDSVYEARRKGESSKGFMTRVDRMGMAHATVSFHLDRPIERADPIAKDGV